jgi:diguanylate cyclase (GGDEF)-like protein
MLDRFRSAAKPQHRPAHVPRTTDVVTAMTPMPGDVLNRARTPEPALIMLEGELPGQVFRLPAGRQLIGRRPECDIRLRERAVSGIHAEVFRDGPTVALTDLESTNGTMLNGVPMHGTATLTPGAIVRVGHCVFRFVDSLLDVEFTERLHTRGITDTMTGAYNHAYLLTRLGFLLDTVAEDRPLSIVALDFDDFKMVNDVHGHAAGDYILKSAAALIVKHGVRHDDLFARIGGEEFVIALPQTSAVVAVEIAERIRLTLAHERFRFDAKEIRITASFGVCSATTSAELPELLLARADELLYRSKRTGRNRVTGTA